MQQERKEISGKANTIAGFSIPLYLGILALVVVCMYMDCLPAGLVGGMIALMVLGEGLNFLGNHTPVVKTYLGGSVICILGAAVIQALGLIPAQTHEILDNFVNKEGFLVFYISALITGSLFNIDRGLLIRATVKLLPTAVISLADRSADCPMAHMVEVEKIREVRKEYPDVAVVCYVNSMAEIKAESDVCVTSSNALKIVKKLPNKDIFFIPDENLGRFIAKKVPEKHFIFNDGFCHVHKSIHAEDVKKAKELHPEAVVLAHPECTGDVLELADFVGSTSQIIDYATNSDEKVVLICTEMGVFYELLQKNPEKKFFSVGHRQFCPNMKKIHLDSVLRALENPEEEVEMDETMRQRAVGPLARMLELAK